ncbi:MAG: hypothetical protein AB8C84_06465 [Oligoflexales bacterium]
MKHIFFSIIIFISSFPTFASPFLKVCETIREFPESSSLSVKTTQTFLALEKLSEKTSCQEIWDDLLEKDYLSLNSKGISDLQLLQGLQPTYLFLQNNQITSLWGLENMHSLRVLSLEKNNLQDISLLSNLNLYTLNVAQNPLSIEGLFAISEMPFLLDLDFTGTNVEDDSLETIMLRARVLENRHQNKSLLNTPTLQCERLQQITIASRLWNFPQIRHDIDNITIDDWDKLKHEEKNIYNKIKATWIAKKITQSLAEKFLLQTQKSTLPLALKSALSTGLQNQSILLEKILRHKISNIDLSHTDTKLLLHKISFHHPHPTTLHKLLQSILTIILSHTQGIDEH